MNSLDELLERVKAASGPDRELDARLYVQLTAKLKSPHIEQLIAEREATHPGANVWLDGARDWQVKPFTASLDAALALVERCLPGWFINLKIYDPAAAFASIGRYVDHELASFDSLDLDHPNARRTPALAVLAALLSALQAQAAAEGTHDGSSPKPQDLSARDQ